MAKKKKKSAPSRQQRVQQILNDAQGDRLPDYQGYRAFWLLPVEKLLEVEIYGQRMIASAEHGDAPGPAGHSGEQHCSHCGPSQPEAAAAPGDLDTSCWPTTGSGGGKPPPGQKRSDRSGLIIGLRGQPPFDGSVFPPLLWNAAKPVSQADIAFIADWIDDGLPTGEEEDQTPEKTQVAVGVNEMQALACGDQPHKCSRGEINQDRRQVSGLRVRKDVRCLTPEELRRLRQAVACMMTFKNFSLDERSWDFWSRIHTNSCQHGWEQFLPWHRLYLYFFEQQLQDYDKRITLPYWDWTAYSDVNPGNTRQLDQGIIPKAYRCWIDAAAIARLKDLKGPDGKPLFSAKQIAALEKIRGKDYNSGLRFLAAAGIPYTIDLSSGTARWSAQVAAVYGELLRINPLWFTDRWPGSVGNIQHYPTKKDVETILSVPDFPGFGSGPEDDHHFGALEEVHNGMHNFAGGVNPHYPFPPQTREDADPQNDENPEAGWMTDNRTTAFDPIFWAHHANVDRLWALWQERHPGVNPEDLDGVLPPWSLSVRDSLSTRKLGYEYVKDAYFYPTFGRIGISRFNSEKPGVPAGVLDSHRKAEVRIHRVQRGNLPNASIRVFLNDPQADASTPIEGNDHFVGQVMTFHGSCYGGPGHCELPQPRSRQFDRRRLHHLEPRNFRIDATQAVQRMLAKGEDDLSVHLVVLGLDGKPQPDALYIEGVSLNFMD